MTFDELRQPWQEKNAETLTPTRREDAVLRFCRRTEKFRWTILRRDTIEIVAALAVIYWFGSDLLDMPNWLAKTGAAITIGACVFVIYKILRARKNKKVKALDVTVHEYVEQEVAGVESQIELLRTVASWYIIPILTGCALGFCGLSLSRGASAAALGACTAYIAVLILLGWGIYWLNQRAVRTQLIPLRDELQSLLDEFAEEAEK